MEENVYICTWRKTKAGIELWPKSRPHLKVSASTYPEAESKLIEAIQNDGGAMCAVMEFVPPLPRSAFQEKYSSPELYRIHGDDRFETTAPKCKWSETRQEKDKRLSYDDQFFKAPVCRECNGVRSPRNEEPLELTYAPDKGFCGGFGFVGHSGGVMLWIFAEDFLGLLTHHERKRLVLQPTNRKGRGKSFFELVGPSGPPFVALRGFEPSGWYCVKCGYRTWGYEGHDLGINEFVAKVDLPKRLPSVFTVGEAPEVQLVVSASRWRELVGKRESRGIVSNLLGVVPDRDLVRHPDLPTREESAHRQPWKRDQAASPSGTD